MVAFLFTQCINCHSAWSLRLYLAVSDGSTAFITFGGKTAEIPMYVPPPIYYIIVSHFPQFKCKTRLAIPDRLRNEHCMGLRCIQGPLFYSVSSIARLTKSVNRFITIHDLFMSLIEVLCFWEGF